MYTGIDIDLGDKYDFVFVPPYVHDPYAIYFHSVELIPSNLTMVEMGLARHIARERIRTNLERFK